MAKLFSHHDKWHVHALLGASVLLHFFVRFVRLFAFGEVTFSPTALSAALLLLHVLLHCTSFQFVLPRNRLLTKPMIWHEFRVHNAIFAGRNLVGAALGIWCPEWWLNSPLTAMPAKIGLVLATVKLADLATERLGSRELRTTNAMPYPKVVKEHQQDAIKRFYAKSQFAATALAVCGVPALSFGSVLAIEIASFLMTLVRKGIVTGALYHIVYGLSLFIMGPAMYVTLDCAGPQVAMATFRAMCVASFGTTFRVGRLVTHKWSKSGSWCASIPLGIAAAETATCVFPVVALAKFGMIFFVVDVAASLYHSGRRDAKEKADVRSTSTKTDEASTGAMDQCDAQFEDSCDERSAEKCDAHSTVTNSDEASATNDQLTRMLHAG